MPCHRPRKNIENKYFLSFQVCKKVTSFFKTKNCFQPLSMVAAVLYFEPIYFDSHRSLKPSMDHELKRWSLKHNIPTSRFLLTSEITINKKRFVQFWMQNGSSGDSCFLHFVNNTWDRGSPIYCTHSLLTSETASTWYCILTFKRCMVLAIICCIDYWHSTPAL